MASNPPATSRRAAPSAWPRLFATRLGANVLRAVRGAGSVTILLMTTMRYLFARPFFVGNLFKQFATVGVQSLPVVTINSLFVGMVLALQGYHQLKHLGSEGLLGAFVSTAVVKELGAVLTAFVLSGRIGAAITAELGTMKVTEQIDAIEAMGASPVQYLVVPRFIACALMLPILTTFANAIAIVGGYVLAANVLELAGGRVGMGGEFFWHMVTSARGFTTEDVLTGLVKSSTFGMIIATIGCYMGFSVAPTTGAEGVGKATTSCAVMSLVLILIADFLIEFIGHEMLGF